jgi:hypothetical protein
MIKDNENTDILQVVSKQKGANSLAQSTSAPEISRCNLQLCTNIA